MAKLFDWVRFAFLRNVVGIAGIVLPCFLAFALNAAELPALKICLLSASAEYDSDKSLADFQNYLESRYEVTCRRVFGKDKGDDLPGVVALDDADLMIVFTRRVTLPAEQFEHIRKYITAGRAIMGIRTASHAFENYKEFDHEVLGGDYKGHYGDEKATVQFASGQKIHPILAGVKPFPTRKLYKNPAPAKDITILLEGVAPEYREPVAWAREHNGGRVFYTSLGVPEDFAQESFRRLLANAVFWTTRRDEVSARRDGKKTARQETGLPGLVKSEFIFESAPFPQCHASTIAEGSNGLVAAWFGGKREKSPDVGIWLSRFIDGKWTAPVEVADGVESSAKRYPCWNPVLFQSRDGPLLLFYKVGPSPSTWWGMLKQSGDGGQTWSAARRLPAGIIGPVKNKPVQLANGELLCPSSTEHDGWRVHFERTPDLGTKWETTGTVNDSKTIGAIQPAILIHPSGRLQALGRTTKEKIFEIWSSDSGKSWGKMTLTELPNPNSGIDAVTLADGRFLLVYNHTTADRSPLNVALSDDGKTWQAGIVLEKNPGEFSYPAVIQSRDGLVHVSYTWKRQRIRHVVLDPQKLVLRPIKGGVWPR